MKQKDFGFVFSREKGNKEGVGHSATTNHRWSPDFVYILHVFGRTSRVGHHVVRLEAFLE